jgi:glycoprotein-N-acetylgalactosamine 3-beta-galactosyltransferase
VHSLDFGAEAEEGSALSAGSAGAPASNEEDVKVPSRPLDPARLAIVSRVAPVPLAYVDASGNHRAHPHMGATNEDGTFGYVHDETALRRAPPPFVFEDDAERARLCKGGDSNHKMLTEKVYVDLTQHEAAERRAEHGLARRGRAKVFCLVFTIEKFHERIPAIRETWG